MARMAIRNSKRQVSFPSIMLKAAPVLLLLAATAAAASDFSETLQMNGFALIRPETRSAVPLDDNALSAQVQIGVDWRPDPSFGAHVHVLARNDSNGSQRGKAGIVEAFLEQNVQAGNDRIHLMEGAFFLPTSRENIDTLWQNPYTISTSALNTWFGEELRPVGVDASYKHRLRRFCQLTGGATVFTGNDTFGALIIDRGWAIRDDWALLGEHIPVTATLFTSVSAETDHRLGWSTRAKWNNDNGSVQLTHIDNRADALRHGDLFNWSTRFDIIGADYTWHGWTAVAESGWGPTAIIGSRGRRTFDLRASYLLLSKKIAQLRFSVRGDQFQRAANHDHAITAAAFWESGHLRAGVEGIRANGKKRVELELRYAF